MWLLLSAFLCASPVGTDAGSALPVQAARHRQSWSGEQPMVVWRSHRELPVWLRRHLPPRLDFEVETVVSVDPDGPVEGEIREVRVVRVAPKMEAGRVVVDHRLPPPECHCSGAYRQRFERPPVKPEPLTVWIIPRSDDRVILRTHLLLCPPCLAP